MLSALHIKNIVLIESLLIEPKGGLCALTGETGAGKSIILDSLGLALGMRSEARLVRSGAEQGQVIAEFDVPQNHPAWAVLKAADIDGGEQNIILRRVISKDGKSKAYINDQPVTVSVLKDIGESLIEIHGQFETHGLMNPATHLGMLDDYAGIGSTLPKHWQAWTRALDALETMRRDAATLRAEEEFLRQALYDLDGLQPQPGEEETLRTARETLMYRERIMEGLMTAAAALNGEHDPVSQAAGALSRITDKMGARGEEILAALDRAAAETQEALHAINALIDDMNEGEHNLETIDERLFTLRAQARKHGCTVDDLAAKRDELAAQLNLIEHGDDMLAAQEKQVEALKKIYVQEAEAVSKSRLVAAKKLQQLVQAELPPLKLDKATFAAQVEKLPEDSWGPGGIDQVRFLVATNPGAEPGPIGKIASGGELARFMLALKVVMAEVGSAGTLIFDEVDAGVGGAVADAVGERLAKLAGDKQVLVVTHAPQIAARAGHHWIVSKGGAKEVVTNVIYLETGDHRREEIARMLSGATITEEARAAAGKLMETGT